MRRRRAKLPQRRRTQTFRLRFGGMAGSFHVSCGYFDDGQIGEVFINSGKVGTTIDATVKVGAVAVSIALQYGAPIGVLAASMPREENGDQSTVVGEALVQVVKRGLDRCDGPAPAQLAKLRMTRDGARDIIRAMVEEEIRRT